MNKLDCSTDPEILGSPFDLNRPELHGVLKRYVPRSALIVGRSVDGASDLIAALLDDGWQIRSCDGPAQVSCPLLQGRESCSKRECADVAVGYVDANHSVTGSLPLVRCAADPSSAAIVALEGQADEPMIDCDRALVGALRTARTIADTVATIAGRP
ncbi:MAG: hypothetical protein M3454_13770 [Actinomycetota bacterium]|nr:hypothetical protein [Actinomycetota bacterium]